MTTPRRRYEPKASPKDRLTDVDAAERAFRFKILFYSLPGGLIGAMAGGAFDGRAGTLGGAVAGFGLVYVVASFVMRAGGAAMGQIYHPSGASTPPRREYSQPQSLAARGRYQEAIAAYEICCAEFPDDPEPYFSIARLYLKELRRYEDAITWFKKARAAGAIDAGRELVATQEIVDIYIHKLQQPRRAMPELARLAERFPGTPGAQWAQEQLAQRRASLAKEMEQ